MTLGTNMTKVASRTMRIVNKIMSHPKQFSHLLLQKELSNSKSFSSSSRTHFSMEATVKEDEVLQAAQPFPPNSLHQS